MSNPYATAEIPDSNSKYLKLSKKPETTFRILSEPIMGTLGWATDGKSRRPVRVPIGEAIRVEDIDDPSENKYFWAMVVYHYEDKAVKILEITQKTILNAIRTFAKDDDYGDPKGYDLKVTKTGEGLDTEYQVTPKPPKPLDSSIADSYKNMNINLNALFTNDDPFKDNNDEFVDEVMEQMDKEV